MPLSTWAAEVIYTVTSYEKIIKASTVYVGEVVIDGETKMYYLYSVDISLSNDIRNNLYDCLNG